MMLITARKLSTTVIPGYDSTVIPTYDGTVISRYDGLFYIERKALKETLLKKTERPEALVKKNQKTKPKRG